MIFKNHGNCAPISDFEKNTLAKCSHKFETNTKSVQRSQNEHHSIRLQIEKRNDQQKKINSKQNPNLGWVLHLFAGLRFSLVWAVFLEFVGWKNLCNTNKHWSDTSFILSHIDLLVMSSSLFLYFYLLRYVRSCTLLSHFLVYISLVHVHVRFLFVCFHVTPHFDLLQARVKRREFLQRLPCFSTARINSRS